MKIHDPSEDVRVTRHQAWHVALTTALSGVAGGLARVDVSGAVPLWRRYGILPLIALAALPLQGPAWIRSLGHASRDGAFTDDVRAWIFPFFRFEDARLFQADYLGDYSLSCFPLGFRVVYTLAGKAGVATGLSKVLPYVLFLIFAVGMGTAARRLSGRLASVLAVAFVFGAGTFFVRMAGGLPRSFGFPLIAVGALALTTGRARAHAALVVIASAFYPAAGAVLGISLVASLALPARFRGDTAGWSLAKRVGLVALALIACAAVTTPTFLALRHYGSAIRPSMLADYPEAGPGGRFRSSSHAPAAPVLSALHREVRGTLYYPGKGWIPPVRQIVVPEEGAQPAALQKGLTAGVVLLLLLMAAMAVRRRHAPTVRLLTLLGAALVGYVIAAIVAPYLYLPQRYLLYPIPVLVTLGMAALPRFAFDALRSRVQMEPGAMRTPTLAAGVTLLVLVGLFFGRGDTRLAYLTLDLRSPLLAAIGSLPPDALIAAWPEGVADNVPYVTRRRVLLSRELHQAFHTGFVEETRRRMRAIVAVYWAKEPEPLLSIARDFGVTHFVVDEAISLPQQPPRYFVPFDADIQAARQRLGAAMPYVIGLSGDCVTRPEIGYRIIDLRCLAMKLTK